MDKKVLQIQGQKDTPEISFDAKAGKLNMSGYSYPENVSAFYDEVMEWLTDYSIYPAPKTTFDLDIVYFNTASSKIFLELFKRLEKLPKDTLEFNWNFEDDDFEMELAGEEFSALLKFPVNLIKK